MSPFVREVWPTQVNLSKLNIVKKCYLSKLIAAIPFILTLFHKGCNAPIFWTCSSCEHTLKIIFEVNLFFFVLKEYGDDKVQLAIQTYELVDKHIRRLDSDLARFESEIQDKALNSRNQEESNAKSKLIVHFRFIRQTVCIHKDSRV